VAGPDLGLGLEAYYALRLQAFGALADFKLDRLALVQVSVSIPLDGRVVHKHVLARLALNETVALAGVEPLHRSLFLHFCFLYFTLSYLVLLVTSRQCRLLPPTRETKGCKVVLAALSNESKGMSRATNART